MSNYFKLIDPSLVAQVFEKSIFIFSKTFSLRVVSYGNIYDAAKIPYCIQVLELSRHLRYFFYSLIKKKEEEIITGVCLFENKVIRLFNQLVAQSDLKQKHQSDTRTTSNLIYCYILLLSVKNNTFLICVHHNMNNIL